MSVDMTLCDIIYHSDNDDDLPHVEVRSSLSYSHLDDNRSSPLSYGHLDDNDLPHAEVRSSLSYGHNEFLDDNDLPHVEVRSSSRLYGHNDDEPPVPAEVY